MSDPSPALLSVCADCGTVYERHTSSAHCDECRPPRERTARRIRSEARRGTPKARGYDAAWHRLSKRARRRQPFCSDCGREDHLTTDHSPEAWQRREAGLPVRLEDVDVVCVWCNSERGPARGPDAVARPTMRSAAVELEDMAEDMADLDQRVARGEL